MDLHNVMKLTNVSDVKTQMPEQSLLPNEFDTVFDGSRAMGPSDRAAPDIAGGEDSHDTESILPKIRSEKPVDADAVQDMDDYAGPALPDARDTSDNDTLVRFEPSTEPKRAKPAPDAQSSDMAARAKPGIAENGEASQTISDGSIAGLGAIPASNGAGDTKAVGPPPSGSEQEKGQRARDILTITGKTEQNMAASTSPDAVTVSVDRPSGRPVSDGPTVQMPPDVWAPGLRGSPVDTDNPPIAPEAPRQGAAQRADNKTPAANQPLSTLERHLGGLAVSLTFQAASDQPNARTITEVLQFNTRILTTPGETGANATLAVQQMPTRPIAGPPTASTLIRAPGTAPIPEDQSSLQREAIEQIGRDVRIPGATSIPAAATGAPRSELATSVIQQVADAMRRGVDKPIEIALSPVELGRVRMVLSTSDAGITVNILADRADTLDLMRRNIDDLGRSFSQMGYEDIAFSFGQTNKETDGSGQRLASIDTERSDDSGARDAMIVVPLPTVHLAIAPDGIDMRL